LWRTNDNDMICPFWILNRFYDCSWFRIFNEPAAVKRDFFTTELSVIRIFRPPARVHRQ